MQEQKFYASEIAHALGINKTTVSSRARALGIKPKPIGSYGPQWTLEEAVLIRDFVPNTLGRHRPANRGEELKMILDRIPGAPERKVHKARVAAVVLSSN